MIMFCVFRDVRVCKEAEMGGLLFPDKQTLQENNILFSLLFVIPPHPLLRSPYPYLEHLIPKWNKKEAKLSGQGAARKSKLRLPA